MAKSDHPDNLDDLWKEIERLVDDEQHREAEAVLSSALAKKPKNPDIMAKLAEVLALQHQERRAEVVFRDVLKIRPTHERAVQLLGRLLDNSLRTKEAEKLYRRTLRLAPDLHGVVEDLTLLLYDEARAEEAMRLANRQVDRFPSDPRAYDSLRHLLLRMEEELENHVIESDFARKTFLELVRNLLDQYDLLCELESLYASENVDDKVLETHEDILRVVGELENTMHELKSRKMRVPQSLSTRVGTAVASREESRSS